MTTKLFRLSAATIFLAASFSLRAAVAPAENLLPADTLAFFTVPDCNVFRATSKTSPQMMFWNDAAMKPFHDKFMVKFREKFILPMEKDLGINTGEFLALPQGQFTLGVTVNGSNGHDDVPPGIVLLLDAKDKSDSLKTNLAALTKKWSDAGRTLRTEEFHGIKFTVVPLNSNDFAGIFPRKPPMLEVGKEPKPEKPGEIYFAQSGSLLIAGNSAKVVEPVAAHLTGGSAPAIADDAVFAADKPAQFRAAPVYFGWFNGSKFFTLLADASAEDASDPDHLVPRFSMVKMIGAAGLGGLKSASFAMREGSDGSALTIHVNAPEATRAGLLKILALAPKDANVPAFVPADAVKFSRTRLDGKSTWAELQKLVAGISPQGLAGVNSVIDMANSFGQQKNPGFDLRTALLGNLGDDLVTYSKAPTGDTLAALADPPSLFLIAVTKPDEAIEALKTLASMAQPQDDAAKSTREFLGKKIFTIALRPASKLGSTVAVARSLYVSASGGYVAVSADSAILEEFLRSADKPPKPLRDSAPLGDALSHVGGAGGGIFGYQNQRETMRQSFKLLKNSAEADTAMKMFPPVYREWADFTLLPDYEKVQKYFDVSVYAGSANSEGLTVKVYSPRPPGL